MITIIEVLQRLDNRLDQATIEEYIDFTWVRPIKNNNTWYFEEIDVARIQLVRHLQQDMMVNDEAMDVVLHMLDQVYYLREQMRRLKYAIERQPRNVQEEITILLKESDDEYTDV